MKFHVLIIIFSFSIARLEAQEIVINDPDWPPFFFAGRKDNQDGFAKEVLETCMKKVQKPYKFKYFPLNRLLLGVKEGFIDVNIYSRKDDRLDYLHYGGQALFKLSYRPIVRKDSSIDIKSIKDFDSLRLGHQIGFRYSDEFLRYIDSRRANGTLDQAPTNESNVLKLIHGRIDVFVTTIASIQSVARKLNVQDKIKILDFNIRESNYYVTVSKKTKTIDDPQRFLKIIDTCILNLQAQGEYCRLAKKYEAPCM